MHSFDRILLSAFEFDVYAVIKESRYYHVAGVCIACRRIEREGVGEEEENSGMLWSNGLASLTDLVCIFDIELKLA